VSGPHLRVPNLEHSAVPHHFLSWGATVKLGEARGHVIARIAHETRLKFVLLVKLSEVVLDFAL